MTEEHSPPKPGGKVVSIYMPNELKKYLDKVVEKEKVSRSFLVCRMIYNCLWLDRINDDAWLYM